MKKLFQCWNLINVDFGKTKEKVAQYVLASDYALISDTWNYVPCEMKCWNLLTFSNIRIQRLERFLRYTTCLFLVWRHHMTIALCIILSWRGQQWWEYIVHIIGFIIEQQKQLLDAVSNFKKNKTTLLTCRIWYSHGDYYLLGHNQVHDVES